MRPWPSVTFLQPRTRSRDASQCTIRARAARFTRGRGGRFRKIPGPARGSVTGPAHGCQPGPRRAE